MGPAPAFLLADGSALLQITRQAGQRICRDVDVRGVMRVVAAHLDPSASLHSGAHDRREFETQKVHS